MAQKALKRIDWLLVLFIFPIILSGLFTMKNFAPQEGGGEFFSKQIIWILVSLAVFFLFAFIDFRFLKQTNILVSIFLFTLVILLLLFILGNIAHGAKSWFDFGFFSFQPADTIKLVLIQPDFGSAMIIFFIWLGIVLVSGISKTHLLLVFASGAVIFASLWFLVFAPYQKARIVNFINPMTDIRDTGYNAFQSTIAVGSGQLFGKGLGFGTQSRFKF